jgi:hypothetical protein
MDRELPTAGGMSGAGDDPVPFYVYHIVNNPVLHAPSSGGVVDVPTRIPAGMVAVFSNGQHVALTTGRMRENSNPAAITTYGTHGHEILELDGKTAWMVRGTIEDDIAVGYKADIHFGWLPDVPAQTTITLTGRPSGVQLYQVVVPQTAFYA